MKLPASYPFLITPLIPQATDSPGRKRASLPKLRVFLPGESACFRGICGNEESPPPAGFLHSEEG